MSEENIKRVATMKFSSNWDGPLKRVGILSNQPYDGFIAIRLEFGSLLSLLPIVLFILLLWEHIRFLKRHIATTSSKRSQVTVIATVAWCLGFWYSTYRYAKLGVHILLDMCLIYANHLTISHYTCIILIFLCLFASF